MAVIPWNPGRPGTRTAVDIAADGSLVAADASNILRLLSWCIANESTATTVRFHLHDSVGSISGQMTIPPEGTHMFSPPGGYQTSVKNKPLNIVFDAGSGQQLSGDLWYEAVGE